MIFDLRKKIIVTDLDGTLLDSNYRWDAAVPSLERLRALGYPLVLNSSKTLSELRSIAAALPTNAPLVAENGGLIAVPEASPLAVACNDAESELGYRLMFPGVSRKDILRIAHELRGSGGYDFEGFADWSVETIIAHTGLTREQARLSSQRSATEPILWNDSEDNIRAFAAALAPRGIRMLRGGRFIHLMGTCDKADGLLAVVGLYQRVFPDTLWTTIALGDGPNDLEMLNAADVAVVIPSPHGGPLLRPSGHHVFTASAPGPAGWHEAITHFLTP